MGVTGGVLVGLGVGHGVPSQVVESVGVCVGANFRDPVELLGEDTVGDFVGDTDGSGVGLKDGS